MNITSSEFKKRETIPTKFTCDGESVNPPLEFKIKEGLGVISFVLIMDDPDAPGGTFTHWIVWNINSDCTGVPEGTVPIGGVEGINSGGKIGYYPPCPPSGTHRYFFKLFALDTKLDIPEGSDRQTLEKAMKGHIIDQAELIGLYSRE